LNPWLSTGYFWSQASAGAVYLVARAEHLAARPRRGTALHPSARTYKLLVIGPLLIAVGAALNLLFN